MAVAYDGVLNLTQHSNPLSLPQPRYRDNETSGVNGSHETSQSLQFSPSGVKGDYQCSALAQNQNKNAWHPSPSSTGNWNSIDSTATTSGSSKNSMGITSHSPWNQIPGFSLRNQSANKSHKRNPQNYNYMSSTDSENSPTLLTNQECVSEGQHTHTLAQGPPTQAHTPTPRMQLTQDGNEKTSSESQPLTSGSVGESVRVKIHPSPNSSPSLSKPISRAQHGQTSSRYSISTASLASTGGTESLSTQRMCFKTKHCRFWKEGRCTRGNECTYAHAEVELRNAPDLSKTKICSKWLRNACPFSAPECSYAHGENDLRVTSSMGLRSSCGTDSLGLELASTLEGESVLDEREDLAQFLEDKPLLLGVPSHLQASDFELAERTPTHAEFKARQTRKSLNNETEHRDDLHTPSSQVPNCLARQSPKTQPLTIPGLAARDDADSLTGLEHTATHPHALTYPEHDDADSPAEFTTPQCKAYHRNPTVCSPSDLYFDSSELPAKSPASPPSSTRCQNSAQTNENNLWLVTMAEFDAQRTMELANHLLHKSTLAILTEVYED